MFWLGAIVSLCYVPGVTGAYVATQWPVLAVLLSLGLLRSGPFTVFHWLGLAFVAYATLRLWYAPDFHFSVFGLWLVWIMALCVWLGTTGVNMTGLYAGLAIGGAVSSFVAVLQYSGLQLVPYVSDNPAGLYINSVQQGITLALIVVALASKRMWLWALPLLPGIALSGSRGAWLTLTVGLIGCRVRRVEVFLFVAGAGLFYLLSPLSNSDQERLLIWRAAWDNLTWFGWGPGVFYNVLLPRSGGTFFPEYAHNDALQLAFEYGIGASLPYAVFAFALCRTGASEWPVVLAFVAASCYAMPLWMPVASFLALVAVGSILRDHALVRNDGDRSRFSFVPWRRGAGPKTVPVASHLQAEGRRTWQ